MTLDALDAHAQSLGLAVRGAFHPEPDDTAGENAGTLVMIGPDEPRFWDIFVESPEYQDSDAHPMDRWSKRVGAKLVAPFGARAVFPYDGPPYAPFLRWAERCGTNWSSPVGLLVHDVAGLFASFRMALAIPDRLEIPQASAKPCMSCEAKPCETACPVGALAPHQPYDVPKCMAYMRSPKGADCRNGCLVRRACPISKTFGRLPEQSAFHMRAFLGE